MKTKNDKEKGVAKAVTASPKGVKTIVLSKRSLENKLSKQHAIGFDAGFVGMFSTAIVNSDDPKLLSNLLNEVLSTIDDYDMIFHTLANCDIEITDKLIWALKESDFDEDFISNLQYFRKCYNENI